MLFSCTSRSAILLVNRTSLVRNPKWRLFKLPSRSCLSVDLPLLFSLHPSSPPATLYHNQYRIQLTSINSYLPSCLTTATPAPAPTARWAPPSPSPVTVPNPSSQGNHYCSRDYGNGSNSYHYSNSYVNHLLCQTRSSCIPIYWLNLSSHSNGSYYYANPNGSTYYNNGNGGSNYTPPSGGKK